MRSREAERKRKYAKRPAPPLSGIEQVKTGERLGLLHRCQRLLM